MTPEEREQMNALCVRIQQEKNYSAFVSLSRQLGQLIEQKELRFGRSDGREWKRNRPWKTVSALASKVLKPLDPASPDTVEIQVTSAADLFRELRIENRFSGLAGEDVVLKSGDQLDVTFETRPTNV